MAQSDPEEPRYKIRGWDSGDDDLAISIRVNGCRFTIPISPKSFSNSPVALSLFRNILARVIAGEDDDPEVWDYGEQVAGVFLHEFKRLAPPVVHTGKLTRADLAPRGAFECEYRVMDERPLAVGITERVLEMEPCDEWNICKIQSAFPVLDPREVEVPYSDGRRIYDIIPQRVNVSGQQFFYKSSWSPSDPIDEIGKYAKIKASNLSLEHLHMSRLFWHCCISQLADERAVVRVDRDRPPRDVVVNDEARHSSIDSAEMGRPDPGDSSCATRTGCCLGRRKT